MNFVAKALNLSISAAERLEERNIIRKAFIKHPFFSDVVEAFRLDKKFGLYEDGTVVVKSVDGVRVFRGFPKIRRILVLNPSLKKHFGDKEIALEEKMNGYNVRVVKIGENLYGLTRRGLICPYTTEKVREKIKNDFFEDYPEYMLCCEAVGPSSPYVPSRIYGVKELEFFVFDIRNSRTNEPLGIEEKEEIAKRYGLKMAEVILKTHPDDPEIKRVIDELDSKRREGIVFKDIEMKIDPLKYTTSSANISDLRYAFRFFGEYARDFMLARIIREGFQSFEFGDSEEKFKERCLRLGEAILDPIVQSIKECSEGKNIYEESDLVFSSPEVLELFKKHLKLLGVDFRMEILDEGKEIRARFKRVMRSTNDRIRGILKGSTWK